MDVQILRDNEDLLEFVEKIGADALIEEELISALEQAWMFECALFVRYTPGQFQWMQVREFHLSDENFTKALYTSDSMWPPMGQLSA